MLFLFLYLFLLLFKNKPMISKLSITAISLLTMIILGGCGNNETVTVLMNEGRSKSISTEMTPNCWFNENTLQQKVIHSGSFASRVDASYPYSYGFKGQFMQFDNMVPGRVDVDFWLLSKNVDIAAELVISIDSAGQNRFWTSVGLKDSLKRPDEWQQIHCKLTLPKRKIRIDDKIGIYIWSKDTREFFMDDLAVKFDY
jgi:hypothetical protein